MNNLQKRYQAAIQNGQDFILTPEDLTLGVMNEKEINSIDDLVMVHKTSFPPNGSVRTPFDSNLIAKGKIKFKLNGELKEFPIVKKNFRNSIHFCLNGGVKSHDYGNWNETKYAIFMPLAQNKDKIVAGRECDLFSMGSVDLNNTAYILCPKQEMAKMKSLNPNVNVVGYEGEYVTPYVDVFLSQALGYKYKIPTEKSRCWDHGKSQDVDLVKSIIQGSGWDYIDHNGSKWNRQEFRLEKVDLLIQVINIIKNENLLFDSSNLQSVFDVIYGRLDAADLFSEYSLIADLENADLFEEICVQVEKETGINLRFFIDGVKKSESKYYGEKLKKALADTIVKQLRMPCLLSKEQQGLLSEKERIELLFEREFGDWQTAVNKGIISKEFLNGIEIYQTLAYKDISTLSPEELQTILNVINVRLGLLSKFAKDKNQKFSLEFIQPVTSEMARIYQSAGDFVKERDGGVYLTFSAPDTRAALSKLSGVNLKDIDEKLYSSISLEEQYELIRQQSLLPNCHIDEYRTGTNKVITDCQLSDCPTVKSLGDRVISYAKNFVQFYNGKKIIFDERGNVVQDVSVLTEPIYNTELTNDFISNLGESTGGRK